MTIALVAQKVADAWVGGAPLQLTITGFSAPANGSKLLIDFNCNVPGTVPSAITQTGVTWVKRQSLATATRISEIWESTACSGAGTTITITLAASAVAAGTIGAALRVFSGLPVGACYDTGGGASGSNTVTTATITPTAGREALIFAACRAGDTHGSPTNGFTGLTDTDGFVLGTAAYLVVASTSGTYDTSWSSASGTWAATIAAFLVASPYTLNVVTQPACTQTAKVNEAAVAVEVLNNGVRDTAYSGTVTVTKASGVGTLSGTTVVSFVNGVATCSNLIMTAADGSTPALLFTRTAGAETVTSSTYIVRGLAYAATAAYTAKYTLRDPTTGTEIWYKVMVPNGAVVGTPRATITYLHQAGYFGTDAASQSAAVDRLSDELSFGLRVEALRATTYPYFAIYPVIPTNTEANKYAWRNALPLIIARLVADGFNIHMGKNYLWGFSTGAIQVFNLLYGQPWFWAAAVALDATLTAVQLTDNGNGPPYGVMPGSFNDPLFDTLGGDTAAAAEMARVIALANPSFYACHGGIEAYTLPDGVHRSIWDLRSPYIAAMNVLLTPDVSETSGSTTLCQIPSTSTKRLYQFWGASVDHGTMSGLPCNSTNWPTVQAWYDDAAQTRTVFAAPATGMSRMSLGLGLRLT